MTYLPGMAPQLHLGDCLPFLRSLPDRAVECVITDPPYARYVYVRALGNNFKNGSATPDRLFKGGGLAKLAAGDIGCIDDLLVPVAVEIGRVCTRWCVVFSDAETTHLWRAALETAGMRYVRTGCWAKPDPMPQMTGDRPGVGFEPCTICHAQGPMRWNGGGRSALWTCGISKGTARPDHPCPKPLPLMRTLVEQFSDPGDTVLDPFMGSGTTGVACKELGRGFIGCELNEGYFEISKARIEAAQRKPSLVFERSRKRKERGLL